MKKRRYPLSLFWVGLIINIFFRFCWLLIPGIILLIVGIFVNWCRYIGLALVAVDIIISLINQIILSFAMNSDTDNEQFSKFQDAISNDGNVFENIMGFVQDAVENNPYDSETNKNNFVVDTFGAICKKCDYGDALEKLNEYERIFYITQTLEEEINNGGFSQFFFNSSGDLSNEVVDAFTKIGALKTAEICKKALSVFDGNIPTDRDEREDLLESLDCDDTLEECDDAFYAYEDDLTELNYAYLIEHREFFG